MTAPRTEIRRAITSSLSAFLQETIPTAVKEDHIFSFHKTEFGEAAPIITVASAGSGGPPLSAKGVNKTFTYQISVWVLRPKKEEIEEGTFTEEDAENQLDDLSSEVINWYESARSESEQWSGLVLQQDSGILPISPVSGKSYFVETFPITAQEPF